MVSYVRKGPFVNVPDINNPPAGAKKVDAPYLNGVEDFAVAVSAALEKFADDPTVASWVGNLNTLTGQALESKFASLNYVQTLAYGSNLDATDATVASWVDDPLTDTGAAIDALVAPFGNKDLSLPDPRQYGTLDTSGTVDSGPAIRAALAAGGASLPAGTIRIDGNLTLDADNMSLHGLGDATHLAFRDGGLVVRAVDGGGYTFRNILRGLKITRTGLAGPALMLDGAGQGDGVARWAFHDVHVESSTGGGLLTRGAYIGSFHGCYFRNCQGWGIDCGTDEFGIGSNLISFFGGESQGNAQGVRVDVGASVNFYGFGIEGNATAGVEIVSNARSIGFYGAYFEGNGGYDLKYGDTVTTSPINFGLVMKGCQISNGSSGKTKSVHLIQGRGIAIEDNLFAGYGLNPPVVVEEHAGGAVRGYARNNATNETGTPIVDVIAGTRWGGLTMGAEGSQRTMWTGEGWQPLDFPSLAPGASAELPISIPGVTTVGQVTNVVVTPHQGLEPGLVVQGLPGTDEVIVRLTNASSATIQPLQRGFRAWAWIGAEPA